ncbi:MAG: hypothetical protein H6862_00075 [Rhodospirillales bacterium]|nr:hypothetical protein [Rhodospirillales bacterium]
MAESVWYTCDPCEGITIEKYDHASDPKPAKQVKLTLQEAIGEILGALERIPPKGDMFISFTPAVEYVRMTIHGSDHFDVVEFYDGRIKTPDTTFLTRGNEDEAALFALVKEALGL